MKDKFTIIIINKKNSYAGWRRKHKSFAETIRILKHYKNIYGFDYKAIVINEKNGEKIKGW